MSDIELLPGARLTPEVHAHMTLQYLGEAKGLIVLKLDVNGAVDITTSQITIAELAYASLRLHQYASDAARGLSPDGAEIKPPKDAA